MNAETSAAWVRRWVAVYTRGLPAEIQRDRRDEIDDDLWSQLHDPEQSGRSDRSLAGEIVSRLLFGVPADVSWRVEQRRVASTRTAPVRSPTMNTRAVAMLAIVGGAGWVIWPIPQALVGDAGWATAPMSWFLFVTVVIGTWALAGATIGLVFGFQDRIRGGVAVIGLLGASIGALSVFGYYGGMVALLLGSAVLVWELGRVGVLDRWPCRAHVAAVIIALVPIVAILANPTNLSESAAVLTLALFMPYGFSWIAIGWSLRHGAPIAEGGATSS